MDKMDATIKARKVAAAAALADRLIANPDLVHAGDLQLYISSNLLEQGLKLLDEFEFAIPDSNGARLKVDSVRAVFSEGTAGLTIDLVATRGDLSFKLVAAASLVLKQNRGGISPAILRLDENFRGMPDPLIFFVQIDEVAPSVSWGPFSRDLKGFVTEFGRYEVNKLLSQRLPLLEVPLRSLIAIDRPASSRTVSLMDGMLDVSVNTPPVNWAMTFSPGEIVILPRGIHLTAKFDNPGATQ